GQAPPPPAPARPPVELHRRVAKLTPEALRSPDQPAVQDDAGAETRAEGQHDEGAHAVSGAEGPLREGERVDVVVDEGGKPEALASASTAPSGATRPATLVVPPTSTPMTALIQAALRARRRAAARGPPTARRRRGPPHRGRSTRTTRGSGQAHRGFGGAGPSPAGSCRGRKESREAGPVRP